MAASDVLAEMVCDDETLQAELMVPQRGLALVAPDQPVKLQYDAFPYQRYGVRYATVRWVSPSSSGAGDAAAFRVLADLDEQTLRIGDNARPSCPAWAAGRPSSSGDDRWRATRSSRSVRCERRWPPDDPWPVDNGERGDKSVAAASLASRLVT